MNKAPLVDTHNHYFVPFFKDRIAETLKAAVDSGLVQMLICAGDLETALVSRELAHKINAGYAVGMHPLFVSEKSFGELEKIEDFLRENKDDRHLCAVGEIGLDGSAHAACGMKIQEELFRRQLKIAKRYGLPVSVHARGAVDLVCKSFRQIGASAGVVHAFNGSEEQARKFLELGFKLGFGGACTYSGSKRIRKTLAELPSDAYVLETDCPDMPSSQRRDQNPETPASFPVDIAGYAMEACALRSETYGKVCGDSTCNAFAAFPRLRALGPLRA